MAGMDAVCHGLVWFGRRGDARLGKPRRGKSSYGSQVKARTGGSRLGMAGPVRQANQRRGSEKSGPFSYASTRATIDADQCIAFGSAPSPRSNMSLSE